MAKWFFAEGPGALVALAAGIVALLFTLFPDVKPFTATELSAHLDPITVERGVTRDQWRWRVAVGNKQRHDELVEEDIAALGAPGDPCAILGDAQGFVVFVSIRAKGFKKRELTLRAALYSKGRRRRVPDPGE